jgi:enterobactin synthetase component D
VDTLSLAPSLFPAAVTARALRFGTDTQVELAQLHEVGAPPLPDSLGRAVAQRRLDFRAGRLCAREALRQCAPAVGEQDIPIGASRGPIWPEGIVGSITHARGYAMAAVAPAAAVQGIGVDIERWLDDGAPGRLGQDLAVPGELETLVQATDWPGARVLTLLFSAKETLFKCLYPQVQAYFGFQQARIVAIRPEAGTDTGEFTATLGAALGPLPAGASFVGRYQCLGEVVVTALTLAQSRPP